MLAFTNGAFGNRPVDPYAQERVAVEKKLEGNPHHLVMAVNGMCCRNCAIGIGKKISLLDFVDVDALPKGVQVHRKESLLSVSVKPDEKVDTGALVNAIRKAGYDPVRLYRRSADGTLGVTAIPEADSQ